MHVLDIVLFLVLFPIGMLISIFYITNAMLPLWIGIPRSLYWVMSGWATWRAPLIFLIAPVLWNVATFALGFVLSLFAPKVLEWLLNNAGLGLGQVFGTLLTVGKVVFSPSTRRDINLDFYDAIKKFGVTPAGAVRLIELRGRVNLEKLHVPAAQS